MLLFEKEENIFNLRKIIGKLFLLFKNEKKTTLVLVCLSILSVLFFVPLNLGIKPKDSENMILRGITKIVKKTNLEAGVLLSEAFDNETRIYDILYNYFRSLNQKEDFVDININLKNLNKLRDFRNEALSKKILMRSINDEVKASIEYNGKKIPIRIRLKGDFWDHLIGEKWSYRVKAIRNSSFLGMREFSLQHPRTRNYVNEFIYHQFLKKEGLPYLRYKFITLRINGKNFGSYAVEESFDKLLIENSGFREGPIIKFNENPKWRENARDQFETINTEEIYSSTYWNNNADLDIFNKNRIYNNIEQSSQAVLGQNLLNEFLSKNIKTSEVFDIKKTALYFAIHDVFGLDHPYSWHNIRFYYDPITARLIPIGYDAEYSNQRINNSLSIDKNPFGVFDDKEFAKEYINQLERISNDQYILNFFKEINKDLLSELKKINRYYPHVKIHDDIIFKNLIYINNRLNQIQPINIKENKNYVNNKANLSFYNKSIFPIEILEISDNSYDYVFDDKIILNGANRFKRNIAQEYDFKKVENKKNKFSDNNKLIVKYKIDGSKNKLETLVDLIPWYPSKLISDPIINKSSNHQEFEFLIDKKDEKIITFKKGNWEINRPIILPNGYKLIVEKNTNIKTNNDGIIIVRGPIIINGTKDNLVNIYSENSGKGILVLNSSEKSYLNFVKFSGLYAPKKISVSIMGAINFYNAPVIIENSIFDNIYSEDALNIIRSEFQIKNTVFKNVSSDAFDSDFSIGSVSDSKFYNIGNDAIDVSGSLVKVISTSVDNSGDKAISVGERSNLQADDLKINNSNIGIASKDLSSVKIINLDIKNTKTCFVAFQKKPEYGPGAIEIKTTNAQICDTYLLEEGSSISSTLKSFSPNTEDVYKILYSDDE